MFITVAICTWNRASLLEQTLTRLREVRVPAGSRWELLVVDNNSSDATPAVLARHADRLPLRAVHEPKQGHSHARNRAVAEARGELLLWTDDDVLVDANWLIEYATAAQRFPAAAYFGGPVRPRFEQPPPRWVDRHLDRLMPTWALIDHGPELRPLKPDELVYGANFAFRTAVLRHYPFDPALGRVKNQLTGGDECTVIERAQTDGHFGVWVGTAPGDHCIPAGRVSVGYVWEMARCAGAVAYRGFRDGTPTFRGVPRWVWRRHAEATARRWLFAPLRDRRWLEALLEQAKLRGMIDQLRAERWSERKP